MYAAIATGQDTRVHKITPNQSGRKEQLEPNSPNRASSAVRDQHATVVRGREDLADRLTHTHTAHLNSTRDGQYPHQTTLQTSLTERALGNSRR